MSFRDNEWDITPSQFLDRIGVKYRVGRTWLALIVCPFCEGGDHRDRQTCIVHVTDGNYTCKRSSCGVRGSFWKFIETQGFDPRDFRGEGPSKVFKTKKKRERYVNGQWVTK